MAAEYLPRYNDNFYTPMVLSCIFFLTCYKYVSPYLSAKFFPLYKDFPRAKQREWNTRVNSSIHAFCVCFACTYVSLYDPVVSEEPIWGDSKIVRMNTALVTGYMLADSIILLVHYSDLGEVFYIFHHSACIYAYYFVMAYGILPWFANYRLIAEFSTPFVNQRWFLDTLGKSRKSAAFMINGALLTLMFFIFRVCSVPVYWHQVWYLAGNPDSLRLGWLWWVLIVSCIVLDGINLFWFQKIFVGARRVFFPSPPTESRNNDKTWAYQTISAKSATERKVA